ncbi:unnamed protein product [Malus baccata var. baccata]
MPVAEAVAVQYGCELGHELGQTHVVLESDSQQSISCLRGSFLMLGEAFQDCRWSWIPRLANLAADHLASRSCVEMCDVSWVARPPSSLVHVLNKDGLPCPP